MNTTDLLDEISKSTDHEIENAARIGELMHHASESEHEEIQALAERWNTYEKRGDRGYWQRSWRMLLEAAWDKEEGRAAPHLVTEPHPSLTAEERNPGLTKEA